VNVSSRSLKIAIFGYRPTSLRFNPWDDLSKIFYRKVTDVPSTKWRRNIPENFSRLSRAHERYRQTTGVQAERVPYLSALEVCSRQGAIQIHVYLYLYFYL